MRKRITSLFLALALCLTLLPTAAFAADADGARETQRETVGEVSRDGDEQDNAPEPDAAVQAAQALIDALPDGVTADNAEALSAQLIAIDEALAALTEEQLAALDITRYGALCEAMTTLTAVQTDHSGHPLCPHDDSSCDICPAESKKNAFTNAKAVTCKDVNGWDRVYAGDVQIEDKMGNVTFTTGTYYLTRSIGVSKVYIEGDVVLCLNGNDISVNTNTSGILIKENATLTLCDCWGGGKITHRSGWNSGGVLINADAEFILYSGEVSGNTMAKNYSRVGNGGGVLVSENASFTMCGGSVSGNNATDGGGVYVSENAKFTMCGGSIHGNIADGYGNGGSTGRGAGVLVGKDAEFTMSGGEITGNTGGNIGGVYVTTYNSDKGFTMSGGSIHGNNGNSGCGGVFVNSGNIGSSKIELSGGAQIRDNWTGGTLNESNGLYEKGSGTASNILLTGSGTSALTITITGELTNTIGVTTEKTPMKIAVAGDAYTLSSADASHFTPDAGGLYRVSYHDDDRALYLEVESHKHPICGKECTHGGSDTSVSWTAISSGDALLAATSTNYYLTADVTLDKTWTPADSTVLCLNGHSITSTVSSNDSRLIDIQDGPFVLTDCNGSNGKYKFKEGTNGRWTREDSGGITVTGGVIIGSSCGGIGVNSSIEGFIMYGGTICGFETANGSGAGVRVEEGSFIMRGGRISGNCSPSYNGGGVYLHNTGCTFTMLGGEVSDNHSFQGGGVYVSCGKFEMSGGSIYKNTANSDGGGVYVLGTLTLGGNAEIKDNEAKSHGGGIFADASSSLNVSGNVQVTSNTDAGGICNLYLNHDKYDTDYSFVPITVTGELTDTAKIGVTLAENQCPTNTNSSVSIAKAATIGWIKSGNFVSDYTSLYNMKVIETDGKQIAQLVQHDHTWGVRVSTSAANILESYCTTSGCVSSIGTLTLTANDAAFNGEPYDNASLSANNWQGTNVSQDTPITYEEKTGETYTLLTEAPSKAGEYRASITITDAAGTDWTATKEFKISRATLRLTASDFTVAPLGNTTYDGNSRTVTATLNAAKAQWFGKITVKYYDEKNGTPIDQPTEAGTYRVKLDVAAGDGYEAENDIDGGWTFTIQQATQDLSYATTEVSKTYGDDSFTNKLTETAVHGNVSYASSDEKVATVAADGTVTIVGAGETTITAKATGTTNYKEATATYTLTINRQQIQLDVKLSAYEFVYDGQPKKPDVTVTILGTTATLDASEYRVVHSPITKAGKTSVTIKDTGSGNYSFNETYVNFTIKPRELTMGASVSEKTYDGTTDATVKSGTLDGVVSGDDVRVVEKSVSGSFDDQYVGTNKTVTLSQNFTLTGNQASNYTLKKPTVTGSIIAADQEPAIAGAASVQRGGKTLDLSKLVTSAQGTVSFEISEGGEYAALNGSTLTTKDAVGTVKITVRISAVDLGGSSDPEYKAYTGNGAITVSVTLKPYSSVTAAPTGIDDLVYNGGEQTLIAAGTATGGTLQYKLGESGTYSVDLPTAKNADTYTVYYKVVGDDNHEDSVEQSLTVTIQRATVTITAKDKSAYVGSQAPVLPTTPLEDTDYTVDGLLGDDTLTAPPALKYVDVKGNEITPDMTKVGETTIKAENADTGTNYTIEYVNGKLTVSHRPSSDSPALYPVNTPDGTANGSVSISPKNASKGSTVTITVKPDDGYQLGDLSATDKDGNQLPLTDMGDGKYTFLMPNGTVDVRGSFVVKTEESPFRDVSTGAYYYDAVKWAVGKDITSGIGGGLFGPNQSCTRAQIVTFLWRAAGSPEPTALSSFTDTAPTAYYAKAVAWAVENGITTGTGETEFSPNAPCTRAQAVTFLYRALKAAASGSSTAFSDVAADAYYASAVAWAVENGVTTGVGGGLFAPKDTCTRAQIVTFLWRLYVGK